MSRGVQAFKQTDVTKAIRAAQNAGLTIERFEIDKTGKIIMIPGKAAEADEIAAESNEWNDV